MHRYFNHLSEFYVLFLGPPLNEGDGRGGVSPKHLLSTLGRIFKFLSILGYNLFICAL